MWVECPDDFVADSKWFDPADNSFKDFPPPPVSAQADVKTAAQPTTTGTSTI